jgi:hypothetical protein
VFILGKVRFLFILAVAVGVLHGQMCVPARILPVDQAAGTLDASSCALSDGSAYAPYRLDLPARGRIQIGLTAGSGDLQTILQDSSGAKVDAGKAIQRAIEAGTYTVLVNGRTPGQGGAYSLSTAFTAEAGTMCTAFPSLGLSQSVRGAMGSSGCALPGGGAYEGYTLNTLGAGTLRVSISNAAFTSNLIFRDDGGYLLASDPANLSVHVDGESDYQVVVTGDQAGAYQLTTSFDPDPDETCRPTKMLSDSGADNDSGSITGDSCFLTTSGSGDLSYFNYYKFTVNNAGMVDLIASSSDFVPTLYLLDDGGNVLTSDSGGSSAAGQSEIRYQLKPGTYTAQVLTLNPSGGNYSFTYQLTPGAPQACVVSALNPGDAPAGTLAPSSCRTALGLADLYTVTIPASGTLDLTLNAGSFNGLLAIRDTKDNLLVQVADTEGLGVTHLAADLPSGTYTIAAAAGQGDGNYQLVTAFTAHDLNSCSTTPLDINGGYVQYLGPASCRDIDGQPVDWYTFTLPADATVVAVMTSRQVAGYLRLVGADGSVLRSDYNSYNPGEPMFVQYLPAGTYKLAARAPSTTVGGYYEVDVRSVLGSRPPFCAPIGQLTTGAAINATLGFTGCQYVDGTFADVYEIDLASDGTIDIQLNSANFDAYLVLLDSQGNVVGEDDDSGGGTNARLTQAVSAGTYYVVAKPLSGYYNVGGYSLSMAVLQ